MEYVIFDLEATCNESKTIENEIIEIGAIKFDEHGCFIDRFDSFVKPKINPKLTSFCKKLTSIKQNDVNQADNFSVVVKNFQNWIGNDYNLCSWGFYDRKQLTHDCDLHNLSSDWLFYHISLKHQYSEIANLSRPIGLGNALKNEKMKFSGTAHRGIDDAENIGKIFVKYFEFWDFKR